MKATVSAIIILVSTAPWGWAAFTPSENANGIRWESASSESWSGSVQSLSTGDLVHLAGTADSSVDTTNEAGLAAFLGLRDRIVGHGMESPTPTGTLAITPTVTPGGPTPTPTLCMAGLLDADFNLDGIPGIDSRDLLLLYAALKAAGSPYDFDCDGTTGIKDLILFSQRWRIENP